MLGLQASLSIEHIAPLCRGPQGRRETKEAQTSLGAESRLRTSPVLGWNSLPAVKASEQAPFLRLPPGPYLSSSSCSRAVLRTQVSYVLTHWPGVLTSFFPVLHLDSLLSQRILASSREMLRCLSISENPSPSPKAEHRKTWTRTDPMTACSGENCASLRLLHPSAAILLCPHAGKEEIHSEPGLRSTDRGNEVAYVRAYKKQVINKAKSASKR